jgi:hypothetical protein
MQYSICVRTRPPIARTVCSGLVPCREFYPPTCCRRSAIQEYEIFRSLSHSKKVLILTSHSHTLLPAVRSTQQLKIAFSTIAQLTQQTIRLRKELDDLHTSSAAYYFDLEDRLITHVARYGDLSEQHHQLVLKHDHILNIMVNMCEQLDEHAERLMDFDDWTRMQPQIMNLRYPSPAPTVDIVNEAANTPLGMREQGVEPLSPLSPPGTPVLSTESAKKCRLVLRLPLRSAVDEAGKKRRDLGYGSSSEKGKMGVKPMSKERVRRRQSTEDGAPRVVKRAKKCRV